MGSFFDYVILIGGIILGIATIGLIMVYPGVALVIAITLILIIIVVATSKSQKKAEEERRKEQEKQLKGKKLEKKQRIESEIRKLEDMRNKLEKDPSICFVKDAGVILGENDAEVLRLGRNLMQIDGPTMAVKKACDEIAKTEKCEKAMQMVVKNGSIAELSKYINTLMQELIKRESLII